MKNILFPKGFRTIGWLLFIPATIMGIFIYLSICTLSGIGETVVNDAVIIGIALGAVFIVCSKEANEDEMTRSIRLAALLNSLYIYVILLCNSAHNKYIADQRNSIHGICDHKSRFTPDDLCPDFPA